MNNKLQDYLVLQVSFLNVIILIGFVGWVVMQINSSVEGLATALGESSEDLGRKIDD